jgi:hypothetical protein
LLWYNKSIKETGVTGMKKEITKKANVIIIKEFDDNTQKTGESYLFKGNKAEAIIDWCQDKIENIRMTLINLKKKDR